jgi:RNase P/RNase MRP subunit p29
MQLEMIPCPQCGKDFPKLRKELYGYHVCVNCSTVEPLVGITTVEGTGDHTYNGLIIMEQSKAIAIAKREAEISGKKYDLEVLDFDKDESAVSQSIKEYVDRIIDEDLDDEDQVVENDEEVEGIQGIDY